MKLKPILTEKGTQLASKGKYSFWVPVNLRKPQIAILIEEVFGVNVTSIKTANYKARTKTNLQRRKVHVKAAKKAVVTLAEKQKIDVFEESK